MIDNPILSNCHAQDDLKDPIIISECTNLKCNEDIYSDEGIEFDGVFFCSTHCLGQHLVSEGQAVDMSQRY